MNFFGALNGLELPLKAAMALSKRFESDVRGLFLKVMATVRRRGAPLWHAACIIREHILGCLHCR
ncbi:hypothetical protein [Kushneria aurantia]|uniref:Transposase n=1 Tax=Kushneria aurantia TaxID=504092 RepID=A0ABV6G5Y3_9GAMM|nr:hypothetical protein [Kushneria aurantia]